MGSRSPRVAVVSRILSPTRMIVNVKYAGNTITSFVGFCKITNEFTMTGGAVTASGADYGLYIVEGPVNVSGGKLEVSRILSPTRMIVNVKYAGNTITSFVSD